VFAGGGLGAGARFGLSVVLPDPVLATFIVNVLGALALGYVLARLRLAGRPRSISVPLVGVGFLGAFTTFSSFAVELVTEPGLLAVAYGVGSIAAGLFAGAFGLTLGRRR
jgi:fluoride exporter